MFYRKPSDQQPPQWYFEMEQDLLNLMKEKYEIEKKIEEKRRVVYDRMKSDGLRKIDTENSSVQVIKQFNQVTISSKELERKYPHIFLELKKETPIKEHIQISYKI